MPQHERFKSGDGVQPGRSQCLTALIVQVKSAQIPLSGKATNQDLGEA